MNKMLFLRSIITIFLFSFLSCYENKPECFDNCFANVTWFKSSSSIVISKSGFKIDTSGIDVDIDAIDERLLKIEKCLQGVYEDYPSITPQESIEWMCMRDKFSSSEMIPRKCLVIKVVESIVSKCSDWQFIKECETCGPALGDPALCIAKGLTPTAECPCTFRTAIQDNWKIVTPPQIYLWETIRALTSCNLIWKSPFSQCAML